MKSNKTHKQLISVLLVLAVLVSTAFALLSSTDSKTNVFTIGQVDIQLWEDFDVNQSGTLDEGESFTEGANINLESEISPGVAVLKQPYIENTGTTDAWIYVTIGIPTATSGEICSDENNVSAVLGSTLNIPVKGYAIQDNYNGITDTGERRKAEVIWEEYFKNKSDFGKEASDISDRHELFTINGLSKAWTQIGTPYASEDGNDYYTFVYNTKLEPELPGKTTARLFESVSLIETVDNKSFYELSYPEGTVYKDTASYSLVSSAPSIKFASVKIDDAVIDRNDYIVSGIGEETIVTFTNKDMLTALTTEAHDVSILATDGSADGVFTRKDIDCNHEFGDDHKCIYCGEPEPGFYDANDKFIVSWVDSGIDATTDYDYLYNVKKDADGNEISREPSGEHHFVNEEASGYNVVSKYPETRTIIVPNTVLSIGQAAFFSCPYVTTIKLADTTTTVGLCAFSSSNVKAVNYGANINNLTSTATGSPNLTEINIDPDNDDYCDIDGIVFSKDETTLVEYPSGKAEEEYKVPETVQTIGQYAFGMSINLKKIDMYNNVETIGERAFCQCNSLETVSLSDKIVTIPNYAFGYSQTLKTVNFGSNLKSIGNYAFGWCYELNNITLPDTLENIGDQAFNGCWALDSITLPNSVVSIGREVFRNCKALTTVVLSKHLESIPTYAFYNCPAITSIDIPDSVTSIENYAFAKCTGLQTVKFGKSITEIPQRAFYGDTQLDTVYFPTSLTTVGSYAFYNTKISTVYYEGSNKDSIKTATGNTQLSNATWILNYTY